MAESGLPVELGLGANGEPTHTYHLVQQRHARLLKRLFGKTGVFRSMEEFTDLARSVAPDESPAGDEPESDREADGEVDDSAAAAAMFENLIHAAEGKLYELFTVFIPDLMPRWEFEGYGSERHLEEDEYVEELDRSPSVPQMVNAFEAAVQVNSLRWVKKVTGFFDSQMLRAEANLAISRLFREARERMDTINATSAKELPAEPTSGNDSQKSQPQNGASASTSSGTSEPTPSEPAESEAAVSASPSPDS